jgi:hypothetical protein
MRLPQQQPMTGRLESVRGSPPGTSFPRVARWGAQAVRPSYGCDRTACYQQCQQLTDPTQIQQCYSACDTAC